MRDVTRAALIGFGLLLLSSPAAYGSTGFAFLTTTIQLVAAFVVLVVTWDRFDDPGVSFDATSRIATLLAATAAGVLIFLACRGWLLQTLFHPIDQTRPEPWSPFIVPYALHVDLRFLSIFGELFVAVACAVCAVALASEGRLLAAAAWIAFLAIVTVSHELRQLTAMPHSPASWPLIALVAWLVAREQWFGALVACAFLVAADSAMLSIVPVMLIAVSHRKRHPLALVAALIGIVVVSLLPLAVDDRSTVRQAQDTIGLTGLLLRLGWNSLVVPARIVAMIAAYAGASRAIKQGQRPLPWIALALLAFSATMVPPSMSVYTDVIALFICAALAETPWIQVRRLAPVWLTTFLIAAFVLTAVVWTEMPREVVIDVGSPSGRPFLYSGFADDEHGDRSFAWVDGSRAEILIPRRRRTDAVIEIVCQPNLPTDKSTQQLSASMNGVVLGTVDLHVGWQTVRLPAPERAWRIGVNVLSLSFTNAISPREVGVSEDPRKLSVAFDRATVRDERP